MNLFATSCSFYNCVARACKRYKQLQILPCIGNACKQSQHTCKHVQHFADVRPGGGRPVLRCKKTQRKCDMFGIGVTFSTWSALDTLFIFCVFLCRSSCVVSCSGCVVVSSLSHVHLNPLNAQVVGLEVGCRAGERISGYAHLVTIYVFKPRCCEVLLGLPGFAPSLSS